MTNSPQNEIRNKVLEILRTQARTPVEEIARRLDCEAEEITSTIEDLEKSKTVLSYQAIVNPDKIDEETCLAIVEVNLKPQRDRGYDAIAAQIYRFPEVKLCYLLSGSYDLLVFIEGESLRSVATFITEKLATIEHVNGTATHFILKKYKEFGVSIGGDERAERLAITP